MGTQFFTRAQLDELDVTYENLHREIVTTNRWSNTVEVVFEHDGRHWQVEFEEPATEMQEGQDVWSGRDEIQAVEVHQMPVTVTAWQPVTDDDGKDSADASRIAAAIARALDNDLIQDVGEIGVSSLGAVLGGRIVPRNKFGVGDEDAAVDFHAVIRLGQLAK